MAAGLGVVLVACSATREVSPTPTSPASLERFVLVIREHPDGQFTHAWQPVESFDLSPYQLQPGKDGQAGRVVPAVTRPRDCDQENQDCYRNCMERPLPRGYGNFTSPRKRGGKSEFCRGACQQAYDDCLELERLRPQEFTSVDGVVDWLRRHRTEVLVGGVVLIAGVAFVVISAGAGVVILAPVVLMASAPVQPGAPVAEGLR